MQNIFLIVFCKLFAIYMVIVAENINVTVSTSNSIDNNSVNYNSVNRTMIKDSTVSMNKHANISIDFK